ncbi:MAG TPA: hypothetical protein DEB31_11285 [Clostridiales bacterium]|nr:hypothetical protein [Clostridiales bacterium]
MAENIAERFEEITGISLNSYRFLWEEGFQDDFNRIGDTKYDLSQMRQIEIGLEEGYDVTRYADPRMSDRDMKDIRAGIKDPPGAETIVSAVEHDTPEHALTPEQAAVLTEADEMGLEPEIIKILSDQNLTAEQMRQLMKMGLNGYHADPHIPNGGYDPAKWENDLMVRTEKVKHMAHYYVMDNKLTQKEAQKETTKVSEKEVQSEPKLEGTRGKGRYTAEQKAEYKAEKQEEVKALTEKLENGVKDILGGEQYKEYLKFMSKFHMYSFRNSMLIYLQNPQASLVAGYRAWEKDFGRHVQQGEQGIRIYAPHKSKVTVDVAAVDKATGLLKRDGAGNPVMEKKEIEPIYYKAVSVFDVAQTKGRELPERQTPQMLQAKTQNFKELFAAVQSVSPVPIRFDSLRDGSDGYYDLKKKEIVLCSGMSEAQTIKTAVHEVAHAKLHDYDLNRPQGSQAAEKDRRTKEVEAESVAFVVSEHLGIDTTGYSMEYVAGWSKDGDIKALQSSLHTIGQTSGKLISDIDRQFDREMSKTRAKEMAKDQKYTVTYEYPSKNKEQSQDYAMER